MSSGARFAFVLGLLSAGCSWARFDDVTENAPIVLLNKPGSMSAGFGVSLATASSETRSVLLVGGATGASAAATFELGTGQDPTLNATSTEYCDGSRGACFLGAPPAGLPRAVLLDIEHELCFALGIGQTPVHGNGVSVRCGDGLLYSYPVPERFRDASDFAIETLQPEIIASACDGTELGALVVGAPSLPVAWYYPPAQVEPVELMPPGEPPASYGSVVAAWVDGDARLFAVAAPDASAVYLYREIEAQLDFIGCLGGTARFGRSMATGVILPDDDVPELAVADAENVHVFDGRALRDLPATGSAVCTLAALPEDALVASFGCGSTDDIAGCDDARFAESLAIGDLDADADGELVVGAPGMTTRGEKTAGAVLVWDIEERLDIELTEALFISSAESNDQLGAALALPRIGERNIIAAGGPGNGKVALFYCSDLLPSSLFGDRCQ